MFRAIRSFFMDEATFSRVLSDVVALGSIAAVTPEMATSVAALFPGAGWLPPALLLASTFYSARQRQMAAPPQG